MPYLSRISSTSSRDTSILEHHLCSYHLPHFRTSTCNCGSFWPLDHPHCPYHVSHVAFSLFSSPRHPLTIITTKTPLYFAVSILPTLSLHHFLPHLPSHLPFCYIPRVSISSNSLIVHISLVITSIYPWTNCVEPSA